MIDDICLSEMLSHTLHYHYSLFHKINSINILTTMSTTDVNSSFCLPPTKNDIMYSMFFTKSDANGTPQSIHHWAQTSFINNVQQQRAFEILTAKFVLLYCTAANTNPNQCNTYSKVINDSYYHYIYLLETLIDKCDCIYQLFMLLTGAAGSAKSEIINQLAKYAKLFCANIKQPFTVNTILLVESSRTHLASNCGKMMHSLIFRHSTNYQICCDENQQFRSSVKMLIIDNVSIIPASTLKLLDKNLRLLTNFPSSMYGGLDVVFVGDIRQLPPIGMKPIYDRSCSKFISHVNCFIDLPYECHYEGDKLFHDICQRFYHGCPCNKDFSILNSRVIPSVDSLPPNVTAICTSKLEREHINFSFWLKHLCNYGQNEGLVIFPDYLYSQLEMGITSFPVSNFNSRHTFPEVLYCYPNARQLLTTNLDCCNGIISGALGHFSKIVLRPNECVHYQRIEGMYVKCVYASQLSYILWEINNEIIKIEPRMYMLHRDDFPSAVIQVPVTSGTTITPWKIDKLPFDSAFYVSSWKHCSNWMYVLLSRLRTLDNLFLRTPFNSEHKYHVPIQLTKMLQHFKRANAPGVPDYTTLPPTTLLHTETQAQNVLHNHYINVD